MKQVLAGGEAQSPAIAALLGDGHAGDEIAVSVRELFEATAAERQLVVLFDDVQRGEPSSSIWSSMSPTGHATHRS